MNNSKFQDKGFAKPRTHTLRTLKARKVFDATVRTEVKRKFIHDLPK